jgi:hypothetical protein
MRRFACSRPLFGAAVVLILLLFPLTSSKAQAESQTETKTEKADTARAEEGADKESSGKLKISIDESGISIEGRATATTPEGEAPEAEDEWVEVFDGRRKYKEKGLDIVKFGESVFVAKDELVRGDLIVFGGNAMIEGRVGGNVVVIGGNIRARSGSVIKGDAVVIGGMLDDDDDAIITGERVTFNDFFPTSSFWLLGTEGRWFKAVVFPVWLFVQLILAFLVVLFLRDRILMSEEHLSDNYLKSFGVGLLSVFIGIFGLIIVSLTLLITIIGIPLAILLWISCAGIMVFSWTVFVYSFGRLVAKKLQIESDNAFLMVFIGAIVINLPSIIAWGLGMTFVPFFAPLSVTFHVLGWFIKGFGARPLIVAGAPVPPAPQTADAG